MRKYARGPVNIVMGGMGSSTLDYVAIPESLEEYIMECEVLEDIILNTSDHMAVRVVLNVGGIRTYTYSNTNSGRTRLDKVSRGDLSIKYTEPVNCAMSDVLENTDFENPSNENIDKVINDVVLCVIEKSKVLPRSKYKPNVKPYWSDELSELKKVKVITYRDWVCANRPREQSNPLRRYLRSTCKMPPLPYLAMRHQRNPNSRSGTKGLW